MPRYSNDGWANLLAAVDYRNAEPERQANNQIRMMQLQALKDAHQKRTALEAYRTGLDAPVTPETTQTVPDPVASAQTDPNALYQEQPTKEVTVPPVYLNEIQKLEKMERYMAMQGNYQEAKQLNEYIKQTKEMGQHNPIVWQAWDASGGSEDKVKQILMAHGATQDQVDDIDFSMAPMGALGSKRAGMYMTREGKTIHNAPKPEDTNKNKTTVQLITGSLREKLGREPTNTEVREEMRKQEKEDTVDKRIPKNVYGDTQERYKAKIDAFEKAIGRKATTGELKALFVNDRFDLLGGDAPTEETPTPTPAPTNKPVTTTPKVGTVKTYQGVKYRFKGGKNTRENWVVINGK